MTIRFPDRLRELLYNGGQIDFRDSGFPSKGINVNDSVSFNVQDPGPVAIELVKKD